MSKKIMIAFVFALLAGFVAPAAAERWDACRQIDAYPGSEWRLSDPVALGWDHEALLDAKSRFEMLQSASVVVVHNGRLIADWGDSKERFTAQSIRKPLLSSLVGVLVDRDRVSLNDTLGDLGIDDIDPPLTEIEKTATLRDLLHSRSGIFHSALMEVGGWKRQRVALDKDKRSGNTERYKPGTFWIYNNWDFNALGTIVEQASGQSLGEFFNKTIARRIGMQDFRVSDVEYATKDHPAELHFNNVSEHRGYMFNISTRDLARYGLLYAGCGKWESSQIIPSDWVLESVNGIDTNIGRPPDNPETIFGDWGFLWQIDRPGSRRYDNLKTKEPFYAGTGNRGHRIIVLPSLNLVVAHQVGTRGGISVAAQMKRAQQGSPTVTDHELVGLLKAIITAHPEGANTFLEE